MTRVMNRRMIAATGLLLVLLPGGFWLAMAFAQTKSEDAFRDAEQNAGAKPADNVPGSSPVAGKFKKPAKKGAGTGAMMRGGVPGAMGKAGAGMSGMMGGGPPGMGAMMSSGPPAVDPELQAEQEALAEQEAETRRLVGEYSRTEDEVERGAIARELTAVIARQFATRQEARERELKQIEAQVRKLRELHDRRTKQKDEIVQDRVRQLLRDADGLGWGADSDSDSDVSLPGGSSGPGGPRAGSLPLDWGRAK